MKPEVCFNGWLDRPNEEGWWWVLVDDEVNIAWVFRKGEKNILYVWEFSRISPVRYGDVPGTFWKKVKLPKKSGYKYVIK